jgi:hypothetical protein
MAETEDEAIYFADLALPDYKLSDWIYTATVVEE